jgi:hypothetical protein
MRSLGFAVVVVALLGACSSEEKPAPPLPRGFQTPEKKPPAVVQETLGVCPGVETAINVINHGKMTIQASDEKEIIATTANVVDGGVRTEIAAIDRATGSKRVIAEMPFAIRPIVAAERVLFVSESLIRSSEATPRKGSLFYRVARSGTAGTEEPVRLLPAAAAITTDGEYIYGIDDREDGKPTRSFRAKVSDLETMTTEQAAGSPLIELTDFDGFIPFLATKSALYVRTTVNTGPETVALQSMWPNGQRLPISTGGIRQAAINDDSIFFVDADVNLKQKIHGSNVTLSLVTRDMAEDRNILADANHLYFGSRDGLGRMTTAGAITRVVNANGTWIHQDATCIYVQGNNYAAFAK